MSYPGPGTTLPDGVVYKAVSLAQFLPPGVTVPAEYSEPDFAYQGSSASGKGVRIGGTERAPRLEFTDSFGFSATLPIAHVGLSGRNGFQFTDPSGTLWSVLDQPVTDGVAANPLFAMAIRMEASNPAIVALLKALQLDVDAATGGNPIVFPVNPIDGNPPCFARGTLIRTLAGEVAVEELAEGDRVVLAAGGDAAIVWIGRRRVHVARHSEPSAVAPVRIAAGALGEGRPGRVLRVSPDHALLLDGALVPAGLLVNGTTIVQESVATVEYFHIELPVHAVLIAEGAAAETYLDTGNRAMFANAPLVDLVPNPSAGAPCAEMVLDGERLDRIRATLPSLPALRIAS